MASLLELRQQFTNDDFRNKVVAASVIKAESMLGGTQAQKDYAMTVLESPDSVGRVITMAVLAANKNATVEQINAALDGTIQTQVDAAIDSVAGV